MGIGIGNTTSGVALIRLNHPGFLQHVARNGLIRNGLIRPSFTSRLEFKIGC